MEQAALFHSNKYSADSACEHCEGIIRHESWCITTNPRVFYAYDIIIHPENMTQQDQIILHALAALWNPAVCSGKCPKK
jgi:hypothetical protein